MSLAFERANKPHPNDLRFAGDALTSQIIKEILTPWSQLDIDGSRPNYEGRTEQEWRKDNARIRQRVLDNRQQGLEVLKANGFKQQEALKILQDINKPILRNQTYATAQAKADEDVNRALLHYSGFAPVREGNSSNPQGTDISIQIPGQGRVMIDAQQRVTPRGLNLEVVKNPNILSLMQRNPRLSLAGAIAAERKKGYVGEGKLLHTADRDFNPQPSKYLTDHRGPTNVKDYLISSNRPNAQANNQPRGPYNRTRAAGFDIIDLNRAREILLPKNLEQLTSALGKGRLVPARGGTLLQLPNDYIRRELVNPNVILDPSVVRAFQTVRRR